MTKNFSNYTCQNCGASFKKWVGKCEDCNSWNTLVEEGYNQRAPSSNYAKKVGAELSFELLDAELNNVPRVSTDLGELDRVLGGGMVNGSAILLGGDPGIGKSTLLLQLVSNLARKQQNVAYITGEESVDQVRIRASRLGLGDSKVKILAATNVNDIISTILAEKNLSLLVIDSIQTMFVSEIGSSPGSVSQVRAASHELITLAKKLGFVLVIVGHVTKDGQIAGPKVLEHMVDTVLYFEGENDYQFRIVRAVKNRYGGVNEIGVFEMSDKGLMEIINPSFLFLKNRSTNISGNSVYAGIEGSRPVLVEVQSLIANTMMATPRRSVVGADINRLAMIIAVLGVRYGIQLADKEVYLNIAGGIKILEPAADLAIACSLISSFTNTPLPDKSVIFGEIGLSGEIRNASHTDIRIKEAVKLGFEKIILPHGSKVKPRDDVEIIEVAHIKQLKQFFMARVNA